MRGREKIILIPDKVVDTIAVLRNRILERFGEVGLANVCGQLHDIASRDAERARRIARRNLPLRLLVFLLLALGFAVLAWVLALIDFRATVADSVSSILQGIEATVNLTVLTGAAIYFLLKWEERIKRGRALAALHELRSIVHVIDMHQLTKDPSRFTVGASTKSSPPLVLNEFQMTRYLDYCSEMLSLTSKVAVLFAQSFPDEVVTEAVSDIERLASGLSQKIWQKIMILEALRPKAGATATTRPDAGATASSAPQPALPVPVRVDD